MNRPGFVGSKATENKRVPAIDPGLRHLDLRKLYDDVSEVLNMLDGAASGIDVYAGYKADMEAERRQYRDEMAAEYRADYAD